MRNVIKVAALDHNRCTFPGEPAALAIFTRENAAAAAEQVGPTTYNCQYVHRKH